MAAPDIDLDKPTFANAVDDAQDAIRDNITWALIAIMNGSYLLPGWDGGPDSDTAEPSYAEFTHGSGRKMKFSLTWTDGAVTGIVVQYDKGLGGGYETLTNGTATLSYYASGNFNSVSWA